MKVGIWMVVIIAVVVFALGYATSSMWVNSNAIALGEPIAKATTKAGAVAAATTAGTTAAAKLAA